MTATGIQLGIDTAASRALDHLRDRGRAWVVGDGGSGRHTLATKLRDALGSKAAVMDLLDVEEADAAVAGLYAAASALDAPGRAACLRDWSTFAPAFEELGRHAPSDFTLIINVPGTWAATAPGGASGAATAWARLASRRARAFLEGVASSGVRAAWITSRSVGPGDIDARLEEAIPLPRPTNTLALLRASGWTTYAGHATGLAKRLEKDGLEEASPVALRLAVGALALGADLDAVARDLAEHSSAAVLRAVADRLAGRLAARPHAPCRSAVARLLLARRPLPRAAAIAVTAIADLHADLVTECVGYGEVETRVSPAVRQHLAAALGAVLGDAELEGAHCLLAEQFAKLDGAAEVADTSGHRTLAWLEKHHHRARTAEALGTPPDLPCRELYWERGRYASIVRKKFAEAAHIYKACVDRFPDDAYAWHYLAWNLERAGLDRKAARAAYDEAVRLDESNPWYNSRRVSFLLGQGKPAAARQAWADAVANVDEYGERVSRDPWLGEQMHAWVARGWLEVGDVDEARAVLDTIPPRIVASSERLRALRDRIEDAVEAAALGESVYPRSVPMSARWGSKPRALEPSLGAARLVRFFPGRVVQHTERAIRLVYGLRDGDRYESRVVDVDPAEWRSIAPGLSFEAPPEYVELGVYRDASSMGDDIRRVARVDVEPDAPEIDDVLPLAYLRRGARGS